MEKYIAKGKGVAINVPEVSLIKEVQKRPLLYDKNVKLYRMPNAAQLAWQEISSLLHTNPSNCKKRWKSLRDTFIKYYRMELSNDISKKHWRFYKDLSFLKPHVELFRSERHSSTNKEDIVVEFHDFDPENHFYLAEESDDGYEIKTHESDGGEVIETIMQESKEIENEDRTDYSIVEVSTEPPSIAHNEDQPYESPNDLPQKNISDPDERYLLSCLPAFKRLTPRQKAQVRIGIEKLFFEVEFESEPVTKKFKDS